MKTNHSGSRLTAIKVATDCFFHITTNLLQRLTLSVYTISQGARRIATVYFVFGYFKNHLGHDVVS